MRGVTGPTETGASQPGAGSAFAGALGLLAGLSTIVYISGGALLIARFNAKDLPVEAVVASLPRELLISVGLTEVVLPLALALAGALALAYLLLELIPDVERLGNPLDDWRRASRGEQRALIAFALGLATTGAALAALFFGAGPG